MTTRADSLTERDPAVPADPSAYGSGGEVMRLVSGAAHAARLPGALSPSAASSFKKCPRSFFYSKVAGLESPPTEHTAVGTLAHYALEHLFDLPRDERTPEAAVAFLAPGWRDMLDPDLDDPSLDPSTSRGMKNLKRAVSSARQYAELAPAGSQMEATILQRAEETVRAWFALENPTVFDPAGREEAVFGVVRGAPLFGIIDRRDEVDGRVYLGDYKSGKPPREGYETEAFFGLLTYGALIRNRDGVLPHALRLIYPVHRKVLAVRPTHEQLDAHEDELSRMWKSIKSCADSGVWPTRQHVLCNWCPFQQSLCSLWNPDMVGVAVDDTADPDAAAVTEAVTTRAGSLFADQPASESAAS